MFNKSELSIAELRSASASLPVHDVLRLRAWAHGDKTLFTFLNEQGEEDGTRTYRQMWDRVANVAHALSAIGEDADRVMLFFPPGLDFIACFVGCLAANRVAVPINLPTRRRIERCVKIIADSGAKVAIAPANLIDDMKEAFADSAARDLHWLAAETIAPEAAQDLQTHRRSFAASTSRIAFIQYTSGSTSDPKGVMVTEANITANLRMMRDSWSLDHTTDMVFWQPHHHDMGLILGQLLPIVLGNHSVLMGPNTFVRQPSLWLRAISKYRAVLAGGPNFAYELASDRFNAAKLEGLDLSHWSIALNGADVVRKSTLERFTTTYAPYGFRPQSFIPCYGLAEATLFVSGGPVQRDTSTVLADPDVLENQGRIVAPASPGEGRSLVGCGEPSWEVEVAIVDPQTRTRCANGCVGEIWLRGDAIAAGYWQNAVQTQATFRAEIEGQEGCYLRTGDIGFIGPADRQVYICGRLKDLIINDGRNLYPEDIEYSILGSAAELRSQTVAVFSHDDAAAQRQRIVAAIEVDRHLNRVLAQNEKALKAQIRAAVSAEHDIALDQIVFVPPSAMRKTTSGKVQRGLMRQLYVTGALEKAEA